MKWVSLQMKGAELKEWGYTQKMTENTTRTLQGEFNADADVISRLF